jgi:hypothetical protein
MNLVQQGLSKDQGNGPGSTISMAAEIVDMIIDHLHDCKPALESCALVSHTWLPASRFHLFRSIQLDPHPSCYHRCDKLYAIIEQSPHLAAIIRELHIDGGIGNYCVHASPRLNLLLDSLTHLNTLHIKHVNLNWDYHTPELQSALAVFSYQIRYPIPMSRNATFHSSHYYVFSTRALLRYLSPCSLATQKRGAEGMGWKCGVEE